MATKSGLLKHPYYTTLIGALLLIGLALLMRAVLATTVVDQHAAVDQLSAIAVKGSIYIDTNHNGKHDANESNYQGTPKPRVKLALFERSCGNPKPSVTPSITPSVTPTQCFTRRICPMGILCSRGTIPWCPPCKEVTVCPTGTQRNPYGSPESGASAGQPIEIQSTTSPNEITTDTEKQTAQQEDLCRRVPVKIVDCPVASDGTYVCTVQNQTFSDAWVRFYAPARYIATSPNVVSVKGPTAVVDFGITQFLQPFRSATK